MIDPLSIDGWMLPEELDWLYSQSSSMNSIVEVGCWKGRSTAALLNGCRGDVYAVDHWLGSEGETDASPEKASAAYLEFLCNVGAHPRLKIIKESSSRASELVPDVEMVFIDASHRYQDVVRDIRTWRPKALKMLCGHDLGLSSVLSAVMTELGRPQHPVGSIWCVNMEPGKK